MHIPDGFLSLPVAAVAAALSGGGLSIAVSRVKKNFQDRLIPMMGVLAAFIFAAQMFNFPVAGGTSGHLLGGVLAAIIVGPMAASVILTTVLIVQCLVFQDGGLVALGANILNMAIVGTWSGWGVYRTLLTSCRNDKLMGCAVFLGSWISVILSATMCALELSLSGTVAPALVLPAMAGIYAVTGIGEGIITVIVVSFVRRVKPELIENI